MRGKRRPEMFATDRGLQARMLVAAVGTPLLVLACIGGLVILAPARLGIGVGIVAAIGVGIAGNDREQTVRRSPVSPGEAPELHAVVERLCVLADIPKPEIVVETERQPNSWVVALSRGRARLHVTRGLLDVLSPAELEAVIGHEIAHLANRDAMVMTAVGGPGAVLLRGGRQGPGGPPPRVPVPPSGGPTRRCDPPGRRPRPRRSPTASRAWSASSER